MRAPLCSEDPTEIFGAASIENPDSLYARLRAEAPISRVAETGVHLVATWERVDEALRREPDFSANLTGVLIRGDDGQPTTFDFPGAGSDPVIASEVIATADEPAHAVHRALAQPRLAAARIAELETPLRGWTREALGPWLAAGGGDVVPVAETVPARAVAFVLGLPDGDVQRHRTWAMMGGDMLAGDVDLPRMLALRDETERMAQYLGEHLEAARGKIGSPDAPLLAALARGVERGVIDRAHAIGIAIVMFGAGGESTAALLGSALRRLAERPALADALRREPGLIPRFVEEVVRLEPPFKFHYRAVRRACTLGGADLAPGDRLMLLWASANRDPAVFEDPDTLRLDRRHPKLHMSFGRGSHFCIGAPLARLEARIVCEELLARTRKLALRADEPPVYARSIFVRRHERVPVAAEPA